MSLIKDITKLTKISILEWEPAGILRIKYQEGKGSGNFQ